MKKQVIPYVIGLVLSVIALIVAIVYFMSVKIEPVDNSSFDCGVETIITESLTTTEDTTISSTTDESTTVDETETTDESTSTEESTTMTDEVETSTVLTETTDFVGPALTTLASTVGPDLTTFQPTVQVTTMTTTAAQTTTTTNSLVYELLPICNSASATYYLSIGSQVPYNTLGGSGRVLKDCSITNAEIKGSVACKSAFDMYGYNYNGERTVLYIVVPDCPAMTGYYYLDDCCAVNNVVDFYFGEAQNCPFQFTGRLFNIEVYLRA